MKISRLSNICNNYPVKNNYYTENKMSDVKLLQSTNPDTFEKNSYDKIKSNVSFGFEPWKLNLSDLGISKYSDISAADAIKIYEKFALGNYLDIGDDKTAYEYNKRIRENNLEFLDRVTETKEKKKFIDYYKRLTGFPDLSNVSNKIQLEFVNAILKAQNQLNNNYNTHNYDILQAGYDGICSVGRNKAFPGSDLDKAYVIIKGTGDCTYDQMYQDNFKSELWKNTDQRILSYNHDEAAFPQVYTLDLIVKNLANIDEALKNNNIKEGFWSEIFGPVNFTDIANKMNTYNEDYVDANYFLIKLCSLYNDANSKRIIKNLAYLLETLRNGVYFLSVNSEPTCCWDSRINRSLLYKYANPSQLKALRARGDRKPKRLAREGIADRFENWSTDKQYRFIKTLILASCANNKPFTDEFGEYFTQSPNSAFAELERALAR